ncbi:penicillin acylase family protein [Robiginitalea sp. M366]|uniref:penicillin acylase family protein n=1 Tax=Robiginitalea aestuariiviva TaxID=3036903 RepID=UPI00240DD88C|nr:penicillin acylase family protein [Robiginitalea aestuariiviva]MDG1571266.1 penicillin acylase family protein [Robiginitalea aestuariiviva]
MNRSFLATLGCCLAIAACRQQAVPETEFQVPGLSEAVEVYRDPYGINHIYALNERDLFFAQGYLAARDRLFQFEIWRRQATGTVAEMLGERELKRDIGTRLFKYRGDLEADLNQYHERGSEIVRAYTDGVNAYISEARENPENLPIEFKALGILPELWTPEVVISRHQGLLGNSEEELAIGRAVAAIGADSVKALLWFHPREPDLTLHDNIGLQGLSQDILGLYNAYRKPVAFLPEDLLPAYRNQAEAMRFPVSDKHLPDSLGIGSNNWVVRGEKMANGKPLMANDPHRSIRVPSLRYMVHLSAPGWNVIGGGEPEIPGVSIGHNEYGAWGLTVFETDGEDLLVYETDPDHPYRYRYQGAWEEMQVIREDIPVKGKADVSVELRYTRHGPVLYQDTVQNRAYAMRCAWMEPGGAPYLASLRMDQAENWEMFRDACAYSNIPGENMIWAGTDGDIGWQAVGIAPVRKGFSGLVPVPGDGRFEWEGYLPIKEKPSALNPDRGYIETANQHVTPETYDRWDAIGFSWSDSYRGQRIEEVLGSPNPFTRSEMEALQNDYFSIPARTLVPYLEGLELSQRADSLRGLLSGWDFQLRPGSLSAGIYVAWENEIKRLAHEQFVPARAKDYIQSLQLERILQWITAPNPHFGSETARDAFLASSFEGAMAWLSGRLGPNPENWAYGQAAYKHITIEHPLSKVMVDPKGESLDFGPVPRGGNGYTVGSTGNNLNQSSGATFRIIVPVGEWDGAVAVNSPGQSGNPQSPYYGNLFETWAADAYFPLYYSRDSIIAHAASRQVLMPR